LSVEARPDCGVIRALVSLEGYYGVAIINSTLPLTAWFGAGAFVVLQHNDCIPSILVPSHTVLSGNAFYPIEVLRDRQVTLGQPMLGLRLTEKHGFLVLIIRSTIIYL